MMTAEEKVNALHERMKALRKKRERRTTGALSVSCAGLCLCLLLLIFGEGSAHSVGNAGLYSGAMLLFEGAGVYVLVALAAFMAGAAITTFCIRKQQKTKKTTDENERKEGKDS